MERYKKQFLEKYSSGNFYDGKYWNYESLFKKSLSKVYQHFADSGFIIGSAFRPVVVDPIIREKINGVEFDDENLRRHKFLLKWLKSLKLVFIVIDGVWKDIKTGIKASELSVMVPYFAKYTSDEFLNIALHWTAIGEPEQGHFCQDAVLVKDPDPNYGKLFLLSKDESTKTIKGIFKPDQIAEFYSQFKQKNAKHISNHSGRTFVFEGVQTYDRFYSRDILLREGHTFV